jgi:hypothetical protein
MKHKKNNTSIFLALLLTLGLSDTAFANSYISNLSDHPQKFSVVGSGNKENIITIETGAQWRLPEPMMWVTPLDGKERDRCMVRLYDHYGYWQDGTFSLQMRRRDHVGR